MSDPALPAPPAETIYLNGNILTGVGLDSGDPRRAQALAVARGEILATGADAHILARYKGPKTRTIDLRGAFVMPGFNDAHTHLGMGGRIRRSVDLSGVKTLAQMQSRIRRAARAAAPGQWLSGGGWDQTLWKQDRLPTRHDIDDATEGRPAIFTRVDGHIAVASSAALAAAGITRNTADPAGGEIDRDATGEPTGILRETALSLISVPPPSPEERRRGLELAIRDAVSHGVTTVQDLSDWEDFLVLEQLERKGKLPLRVSAWLRFDEPLSLEEQQRAHRPGPDRRLRTTMLKGFLDGSLGSRTAAMKAPYADAPGNSGLPRFPQDALNAMAIERARAGFQLGFHAIGDRAVEMALDAFAAVQQALEQPQSAPGPAATPDRRHRIEHSQVVSAGDFARYRRLGVIASAQPNHLLTDIAWAEQHLGPERSRFAYAWKSFLDAGVPLAFGTDYPIEPITPFPGIYAAVTRMNRTGTMTFHPEQSLTVEQALCAYTQGAAFAEIAETWKGKLAPGYVADFVVLDRDLTAIPPREILQAQVLQTVVAGRVVYQRRSTSGPTDRHVASSRPADSATG